MSNNSSSIGILDLIAAGLFCTFVGLKLTHNIDWSWWWIFSPLWIGYIVLPIVVLVVIFVVASFIKASKNNVTFGLAYVTLIAFVIWFIHNFVI